MMCVKPWHLDKTLSAQNMTGLLGSRHSNIYIPFNSDHFWHVALQQHASFYFLCFLSILIQCIGSRIVLHCVLVSTWSLTNNLPSLPLPFRRIESPEQEARGRLTPPRDRTGKGEWDGPVYGCSSPCTCRYTNTGMSLRARLPSSAVEQALSDGMNQEDRNCEKRGE